MVTEADLQYLRNINTKPGPDAGRSIDPAKPGPDDDFLGQMRATEFLAGQPHAGPVAQRATHVYDSMQEKQSDAELWRRSAEMAAGDNAALRKAGTTLAEAALRVIREYDGTHRLALAVAEWSTVVANEGGRAAIAQWGPDDDEDAERILELEAECGRLENDLFEARAAIAQSAQYEITTSQAEHDRNIAGFEALLANLKSVRPPMFQKAADEIDPTKPGPDDAEPVMLDRLAVYLMALDECGVGDDPKSHIQFFENLLAKQRNTEHSGDCKKEPWSCSRCICDEYLEKASHLLSAFPALAQSDAKRIVELEAECGRLENDLFEARAALAQSETKRTEHFPNQQLKEQLKEWKEWEDRATTVIHQIDELTRNQSSPASPNNDERDKEAECGK